GAETDRRLACQLDGPSLVVLRLLDLEAVFPGIGDTHPGFSSHDSLLPSFEGRVRDPAAQLFGRDHIDQVWQLDRLGLVERAQLFAEPGEHGFELGSKSLSHLAFHRPALSKARV